MSLSLIDKVRKTALLRHLLEDPKDTLYHDFTLDALMDMAGDDYYDIINEFRHGDLRTESFEKYCMGTYKWLRYYEFDYVAAQMYDNTWVGWPYCRGGGKHGEPTSFPWLDNLYELKCTETVQTITVREFSIKC